MNYFEIFRVFTGIATVLLLFIAIEQLRLAKDAELADIKLERAQLVKDVLNDMFSDKEEKLFFYKIDYGNGNLILKNSRCHKMKSMLIVFCIDLHILVIWLKKN